MYKNDTRVLSRYRNGKKGETRIVTFGLAKDTKVSVLWIGPDSDLR